MDPAGARRQCVEHRPDRGHHGRGWAVQHGSRSARRLTGARTVQRVLVRRRNRRHQQLQPTDRRPGVCCHAGQGARNGVRGRRFKNLDGRHGRVFLLDAKSGQVIESFRPAAITGPIVDLALVGDRLFIGGTFTHVGGAPHLGIASLDADTGNVDPFVNIQMEGNHNWTPTNNWARGWTGTVAFDVAPDGSKMAVVGNFKTVDGQDLDQALLLDLTGPQAEIADWSTDRYDATCSRSFDTYVRDVKWSPDGKQFSVVTTGAGFEGTLCDTLATWAADDLGQDREPVWVDEAGGDSLYSVSHTDSAVYMGGHRAMGQQSQRPRLRQSWRCAPRRAHRRGPQRLGADRLEPRPQPARCGDHRDVLQRDGRLDGVGRRVVRRLRNLPPTAGVLPDRRGRKLAPGATQDLPAYYYQISNSGVDRYFTDGTTIEDGQSVPSGNLSGRDVRGAFMVDDSVFYGASDGYLYRRSFDGSAFGAEERIDPYNDPAWATVRTGSGSSVYRGKVPQLYGQFNNEINGMEVKDNTLYFTRPGDNRLYRTGFSADSGIIEPFDCYRCSSDGGEGHEVPGALTNPGDFVFVDQDIVYVDTANGTLMKAPLTDSGVGASQVLDDSRDYRGRGLFLAAGPGAIPNQPPTAEFAADCTVLSCDFDASASKDPDVDGTISDYAWDFGDGATGSGRTAAHDFAASGQYTVTLTVTDDRGDRDTTSREVDVRTDGVEHVGSSGVNRNLTTADIPLPEGVREGDTVVLTVGSPINIADMQLTGAGSWSEVGSYNRSNLWMAAFSTTLTADDLGKDLTVTLPSWGKVDLQLVAYRGPAAGVDVSGFVADATFNPSAITSPDADVTESGSWALTAWYARSATVESITAPNGVEVRGAQTSQRGGHTTSVVADTGTSVPAGTLPGLAATPDVVPPIGGAFTVLVSPR